MSDPSEAGGASPAPRRERAADRESIRDVIERAFGQSEEAELVDALRAAGGLSLSMVAEHGGRIVAHVAFSPLEIDGAEHVVALAPLAVLPEYQGRGFGTRLTRAALELLRAAGTGACVVLGHPTYYSRFGFRPAAGFGLRCPYPAPAEAYQALELRPGALAAARGEPRYHSAFASS